MAIQAIEVGARKQPFAAIGSNAYFRYGPDLSAFGEGHRCYL